MRPEVHQFHPVVSPGDAVGDCVVTVQRLLRHSGYRSQVFCEWLPPFGRSYATEIAQYGQRSSSDHIVLLHYSMNYSAYVMDWLGRIPDRKILVYHNITPHHYFAGINNAYLEAARAGRADLERLRTVTEAGWGASAYNCRELEARGWTKVDVLPIAFDPIRYTVRPDRRVLTGCQAGPNVISVGRIAPNKRLEDLILAFYFLKRTVRPEARLFLIGSARGMETYLEYLQALVSRLALRDVVFTGHVSTPELVAYYRCADVYVSMSEHEGFGVPLLESMYFGVPIIAYKVAAVPETLGGSGILFSTKDFPAIAELIGLVLEDNELRARMVARQKRRLQAFMPAVIEKQLTDLLSRLDS